MHKHSVCVCECIFFLTALEIIGNDISTMKYKIISHTIVTE